MPELTSEPPEPPQDVTRQMQRKVAASRELTLKQRTFARKYAQSSNATQSAIKAGYSVHTAQQIGYRLTKHPKVVELVKHEWDQVMALEDAKPLEASQARALQRSEFVQWQINRLLTIIDCNVEQVVGGLLKTGKVPEQLRDAVLVAKLTPKCLQIVLRDKSRALTSMHKLMSLSSIERPPVVQ